MSYLFLSNFVCEVIFSTKEFLGKHIIKMYISACFAGVLMQNSFFLKMETSLLSFSMVKKYGIPNHCHEKVPFT